MVRVALDLGTLLIGDPKKVEEQVKNELVSVAGAEKDYGVIVRPGTFEVDYEGTRRLRKKLKGFSV